MAPASLFLFGLFLLRFVCNYINKVPSCPGARNLLKRRYVD